MGVKVSVIVSIHNPAESADACLRSVLEQTLPAESYEVIFVDDGSTDGTAQRLDTVAAGRRNVRVLHLPRSGSPMRGRNLGIAAARGTYLYLMGQSDRLERDALAHMYAKAVETDADVLVGRLVRGGAPLSAFQAGQARADIMRDRLLSLLTPHKLYRRAFLAEHALTFAVPGGRVAEQAFALQAYLLAKVIAITAEQVCCHLGEPETVEENPRAVVAEVRAMLALIDAHTQQGRQRTRMHAHWLRTAVLRPFLSLRFANSSVDRGAVFSLYRTLVLESFPPEIDRFLPVPLRVVASQLRAGRLDQIIMYANASRRIELRADLGEVRWQEGVLLLGLGVEIYDGDGHPVTFRAEPGRVLWHPPRLLDGSLLPDDTLDVTAAIEKARLEVYIRNAETGVTHFVPVVGQVALLREGPCERLRIEGQARLDITTAAMGGPLGSGQWEVHVRMYGGAHHARARVRRTAEHCPSLGAMAERPSRRLVVPCWSDAGELGFYVEPRSFSESVALVSPGATVTRLDQFVYVVVPVPYVPPSGGPALELVLRHARDRNREITAPALVEPGVPGRLAGQLVAKLPLKWMMPGKEYLGPGAWTSFLRTEDQEIGLRFGLEVRGRRVAVRPSAAMEPEPNAPMGVEPLLHRMARRVPGARYAVRLARTSRHRYLSD